MSIYDELIKSTEIPDAFCEWKNYREDLTNYILSVTKPDTQVAIFGAGACNDLDIKKLSAHFSKMTLIDQNKEILVSALHKYGQSYNDTICIQEADFVGITPNDYRNYADDILKMIQVNGKETDINEVAQYALFQMENLYGKAKKKDLSFGIKAYDYSIVAGVHSQINNMFAWLWQVYSNAIGKKEDRVFRFVEEKNTEFIERFNDAVFSCTKEASIIGLERQRIGMEGSVQGALQCFYDIIQRQEKGQILVEDAVSILWPFDPSHQVVYEMVFQYIKCMFTE